MQEEKKETTPILDKVEDKIRAVSIVVSKIYEELNDFNSHLFFSMDGVIEEEPDNELSENRFERYIQRLNIIIERLYNIEGIITAMNENLGWKK